MCRVISDGKGGADVPLGARPVSVGAGGENDLVLQDAQVSRKHAEIRLVPEGVRVIDLGSTNGTFFQASRVTDLVVPVGSTVKFGNTSVRFAPQDVPTLPPSQRRRFGSLVGSSLAMREVFGVLELASPAEATVLLEGESGTGKELAARAIHDHSERAGGPMVVVDCSTLADNLIESQLFGHLRGAFTGADRDRKGAFVEATGGTLFLDEIGEMSLQSQAKLLRALEAQTVQPLGADRPVKVDTRVVAATHRNLMEMVEEKTFRFDLFFRLAVVHVRIPPLRERPEDIPELVRNFYEGRGQSSGSIEGPNVDKLMSYGWPGNVRELRNVMDRAWALSGPTGVAFADLRIWVGAGGGQAATPVFVDTALPFKEAKEQWVGDFERRYLAGVYASHDNNITHAAEHAGINRRHFRNLLRKHGIIDG
jgi:DNA-binding NtrC family response regulator